MIEEVKVSERKLIQMLWEVTSWRVCCTNLNLTSQTGSGAAAVSSPLSVLPQAAAHYGAIKASLWLSFISAGCV